MATLGTLTGLAFMLLGLHGGKKLLKNIRSGAEQRKEQKIQRMEEKLNKFKMKRSSAVDVEKGNAAYA